MNKAARLPLLVIISGLLLTGSPSALAAGTGKLIPDNRPPTEPEYLKGVSLGGYESQVKARADALEAEAKRLKASYESLQGQLKDKKAERDRAQAAADAAGLPEVPKP